MQYGMEPSMMAILPGEGATKAEGETARIATKHYPKTVHESQGLMAIHANLYLLTSAAAASVAVMSHTRILPPA